MSVSEASAILGNFVKQHRIEIQSDRIIVKNINDFSRFVSTRRNSNKGL